MLQKLNPASIMEPFNNAYHHAVVIPPNARMVYVAGQVGLRPENVVKINAYLIDTHDYPAFAAARTKHLGDARPASTAVLIKQLIFPEWRFEIDAVAAAPG